MNRLLIPALVLAASLAFADDPPSLIQIDAEFIELPEPAATDLLHSPDAPKSGSEWREKINQLIKNKTAAVAASLSVITKSGNQATAESAQEVIYPTEFEPPEAVAPAKDASVPAATESTLAIPTPTAFEMRKAGMILQVEPVLGADGKTIDLNFSVELVSKAGDTVQQAVTVGGQTKPTIKHPAFYASTVKTCCTLLDGSSTLAGMMAPHDSKGELDPARRLFCIVTARLVKP